MIARKPLGREQPASEIATRASNGASARATAPAGAAAAPLAGPSAAAAGSMPEQAAAAWSDSLQQLAKVPAAAPGAARDALDYWVDSCQRAVLFWDVLRQRGNQAIEHYKAGKPPVLVFDYEMVVDGRQLERPVNYALVRIRPEAGASEDPTKRPFVIVDPRAGHGPASAASRNRARSGWRCGQATRSTS